MANRVKPRGAAPLPATPPSVKFVASVHIRPQFRQFRETNPEIQEAVEVFNKHKRLVPPQPLPGKMRDHVLDGKLKGIRECHLSGDILLLYTHKKNVVRMLYICRHSDLYGKRARQLRSQLESVKDDDP